MVTSRPIAFRTVQFAALGLALALAISPSASARDREQEEARSDRTSRAAARAEPRAARSVDAPAPVILAPSTDRAPVTIRSAPASASPAPTQRPRTVAPMPVADAKLTPKTQRVAKPLDLTVATQPSNAPSALPAIHRTESAPPTPRPLTQQASPPHNPTLTAHAASAAPAHRPIPVASRTSVAVGVHTGNVSVALGYGSGYRGHSRSSFSLGINLTDPYCRPYSFRPYICRPYAYYDPYCRSTIYYSYSPYIYYVEPPTPVYYSSSIVTAPAVIGSAPSYAAAPTYTQTATTPIYTPDARGQQPVEPIIPSIPPTQPAAAQLVRPVTPAPAPPADPWSLLASGQLETSHELFTRAVERDSLDGASKVGLALSRAALNDHANAALWMRRSLSVDPQAILQVRLDQPLRNRIDQLIGSYQDQTTEPATRSDAFFMIAALQTLQGDLGKASNSIRTALASGDNRETTIALRRVIEHQLDRQPAPH